MNIPFNKPSVAGDELLFIEDAIKRGHLSGNGYYVKKCQSWFEERYQFGKCLLTTSCTDALEMTALLMNIKEGDEIIMPTYTFVSTANAFALRGAEIIFIDSTSGHPNMDVDRVESAISEKTKAIIAVHYAGVQSQIEHLQKLAKKHNIFLVEDAAQAIAVNHNNAYLGSYGDFATFSFHETKNVQCGEGGMLVINNPQFTQRAEVIWEKGTNRQAFYRGQVDKYRWVDIGSSYLLSDLNAAYLWGQLQHIDEITNKRRELCRLYAQAIEDLKMDGLLEFPPEELVSPNGHLFYILLRNAAEREALTKYLLDAGIMSVFHYQCLHLSPYYLNTHSTQTLSNAQSFEERLLRLPVYNELSIPELNRIVDYTKAFFYQS